MAHEQKRPSTSSPEIDQAAKRAFFRIMDAWGVAETDAITLLGGPSRATFYNYKKGAGGRLSADMLDRVSYILGIYKALQLLFIEKEQADTWIRKPNAAFGGQSALQRMLAGKIVDLAAVRTYLDAVRGGGE